jgi:hypothetical protein
MKQCVSPVISGSLILGMINLLFVPRANAVADYWSSGFPAATVSSLKWTIDIASVSATYQNNYIIPGSQKWNGISSKVNVVQGTSNSYNVRFFVDNTLMNPSVVGLAQPCCAAGNGDICKDAAIAGVQIFTAARIYLYEAKMANQSFTTDRRIADVAHEVGHILSMKHTFSGAAPANTPSLMAGILPMVSTIQNLDKVNLKGRWGN